MRRLADPARTSGEPEVTELEGYLRRVWGNVRAYVDSLGDQEFVTPREMSVDGDTLGLQSRGDLRARHAS